MYLRLSALQPFQSEHSNSKYQIELQAIHCGADYSVIICGGERGHVGAVALGCNESGINGHENRGATVSVQVYLDEQGALQTITNVAPAEGTGEMGVSLVGECSEETPAE